MSVITLQAAEKVKQCFCSSSKDCGSSSSSSDDGDAGPGQYELDENKDRGNWTGRLDFVISLVGSVGQGQGQIKVTRCVN